MLMGGSNPFSDDPWVTTGARTGGSGGVTSYQDDDDPLLTCDDIRQQQQMAIHRKPVILCLFESTGAVSVFTTHNEALYLMMLPVIGRGNHTTTLRAQTFIVTWLRFVINVFAICTLRARPRSGGAIAGAAATATDGARHR